MPYFNHNFTYPTSDRKYIRILKYISCNPFSTIREIGEGIGAKIYECHRPICFNGRYHHDDPHIHQVIFAGYDYLREFVAKGYLVMTKHGRKNAYEITPKGSELIMMADHADLLKSLKCK